MNAKSMLQATKRLGGGLALGLLVAVLAQPQAETEGPAPSSVPAREWTNSLGMEFVWIPAGTFVMGSPEGEAGRDADEGPQREVEISRGFWMGKYEVTQGEWEAVMGSNPSSFKACGSRCPVETVSWLDVQEFIRKLNDSESAKGYEYRLPTEAEWEYAARAGSSGATPEGELRILGEFNAPELDGQAWYGGNNVVSYEGGYPCSEWGWGENRPAAELCGPHPVGMKRGNGWGLHDMLGNVSEWVGDWYGAYRWDRVTDPRGPYMGPGDSPKDFNRVLRGGGWYSSARFVRSAARDRSDYGHSADTFFGFRLVRTKPPPVVSLSTPSESGVRPGASGAGSSWESPLEMDFAWVPAGRFVMGSPVGEVGREDNEGPQREVEISRGFWMGKYEVTQGEWEAVMGSNPSSSEDCDARCPVETVSWLDVQEFIRKLNDSESAKGYEYRLPTEAEWEYAARAGTTVATPEGELRILEYDNVPVLDRQAWYSGNSGGSPHPVGMKRANAWGLQDMLGNVWEWVGDWYGAYWSGSVKDPSGPRTGSDRVIRGGGIDTDAHVVRSASRGYHSPDDRHALLGFRLVRTE